MGDTAFDRVLNDGDGLKSLLLSGGSDSMSCGSGSSRGSHGRFERH